MQKRIAAILVLAAGAAYTITRPADIRFLKHELDIGAAESCAILDVNGDGKLDIMSGEDWYEGPGFQTKHHFRSLPYLNNYVDSFSILPMDVNGDGKTDIVDCAWFAKKLWWNEQPANGKGEWKEHVIASGHNVEFCFAVDLLNDGKKRQVIPQFGGKDDPLTWYEIQNGDFVAHVVSPHSYGHGIGVGDVNGDGRNDIITPKGWFEAPVDPRSTDWKWHGDFDLDTTGFIHVLDVNGDGKPDLVSGMAHNYGVFWLEQGPNKTWTKHVIDDSWSQAHAMTLVDLNGDGKLDILTGKRYSAHNGHDPGGREPLGIYWYEYVRTANGQVEWVKHVIDYSTRTGSGMQIAVADLNRDGFLDFAVAGKSGLYWFENLTGATSRK
jgi:hypothetical protein